MKAKIKQFIKLILTYFLSGNNLVPTMLRNVMGGGIRYA